MDSEMTLVLKNGEEKAEAFPLGKFGGTARLAWGERGRRGAIWIVRANPNGEVYVMERNSSTQIKASLHRSGVWRYAFVQGSSDRNPRIKAMVDARGDRVLDRWDRPSPLPGGGATVGYTIFTSGQDITPVNDDPGAVADVLWLPPPAYGEMAILKVSFIMPDKAVRLTRGTPVFASAMKTGKALLITAYCRDITAEEKAELSVVRARLANSRAEVAEALPNAVHIHALMPGQNQSGDRHVFDFAFEQV